MTREYTKAEVIEQFMDKTWQMIYYWAKSPNKSIVGRISGFAFSMMAELDGCSSNLPKFIVAPDPHPDDKSFCESEGVEWFPEDGTCDISGSLHEVFREFDPGCTERDISATADMIIAHPEFDIELILKPAIESYLREHEWDKDDPIIKKFLSESEENYGPGKQK
jgi:hypothetical protein